MNADLVRATGQQLRLEERQRQVARGHVAMPAEYRRAKSCPTIVVHANAAFALLAW